MLPRRSSAPGVQTSLAGIFERAESMALIRWLLWGAALIGGAWIFYFAGVTLIAPYPLEYREGAAQLLTQLLQSGRNPFALENQPLGMTNYGIGYSLGVLPFAALLGNTLFVNRAVTLVFILLSAFLVFKTAAASARDSILAIVCAELVAAGLATRGGLGAVPGAMGAFLFVLGMWLPFNRAFDARGLLLSIFAILLAFYTKPYFLLAFGIVASYTFLFVSKKKGLIYVVAFAVAASLTVILVRSILPLYFFDVLFSNLAQTVDSRWWYPYRQLGQLGLEFFPSLIATLVVMFVSLAGPRARAAGPGGILGQRDLLSLDTPLLSRSPDFFGYATVCSLSAFVLVLGTNTATYMTYCYQLILPPFFLWLGRRVQPGSRMVLILLPLQLISLLLFCRARLGPSLLQESAQAEVAWRELYASVDQCTSILNSPLLVSEMIRRGMWPIDSGHTEYYYYSIQQYPGMRLLGANYDAIAEDGTQYLQALSSSVAHQAFDCIVLARYSGWPPDLPLRRGRYRIAETIDIAMPQSGQRWLVDIWRPLKEQPELHPSP